MPSIPVAPYSPAESTTGGPVIAGTQFRRVRARSVNYEPVRTDVDLASGSTRSYDKGRRRVVSLSWGSLTEAQATAIRNAVAPPFVTYADDAAAESYVVGTGDGISVEQVAGTFPVRYAATLTLRERDPA